MKAASTQLNFMARTFSRTWTQPCKMLKKAVQQGRSRRKHRRRTLWAYVEDAFEGRTLLADFFSLLLDLELGVVQPCVHPFVPD